MLKKNRVFSSLLSLILVATLSFGFNFAASAETVERYKITGIVSYDSRYATGFESLDGTYPIFDGLLERSDDSITIHYNHGTGHGYNDPINIHFIKDNNMRWGLNTFNNIDYLTWDYPNMGEPIFSNTQLFFLFVFDNGNDCGHLYMYFQDIVLEPIFSTISTGQYKGTGTASVETVFGTFNLGNLAKTKINAVVTDNQLDLSFQAKNIPYQVQANLDSIDSDGMATYTYAEQNESWQITVTPDGKLDGSLTYTGDRGTMNFSMQLQAK